MPGLDPGIHESALAALGFAGFGFFRTLLGRFVTPADRTARRPALRERYVNGIGFAYTDGSTAEARPR